MLCGTERDLWLPQGTDARVLVLIKTYIKNENSNCCRVFYSITRRIIGSRSVIFIKTPSFLLPASLTDTPAARCKVQQ